MKTSYTTVPFLKAYDCCCNMATDDFLFLKLILVVVSQTYLINWKATIQGTSQTPGQKLESLQRVQSSNMFRKYVP
jgi:hypothetical protein